MPTPGVTYQIFVERRPDSIMGVMSVVGSDGSKPFDRIPIRSGQRGFTGKNTLWVRGKSPCPPGVFNVWTDSNNKGQVAGLRGIGEAFPVDTEGDRWTIKGSGPGQLREEIMIHEENSMAGSAGCIVVVSHAQWRKFLAFMHALNEQRVPRLKLTVFFKT